MADPSGAAIVVGCVTSAALAALYGRFDKSLSPYEWWAHYAKALAPRARRLLCLAHAVVGLVAGIVLAVVTRWFPFGTGLADAAVAGAAWAALGETAFRAEAAALDLGRAKPGVSLIRKFLSGVFERLDRTVNATIDDSILKRCSNVEETVAMLIELLGLEAESGSLGNSGAAAALLTWSQRLRSGFAHERDAARVEALQVIKSIVVEQRVRL